MTPRKRGLLAVTLVASMVLGAFDSSAGAVCTQNTPHTFSFLNGKQVKTRPFGQGSIVTGIVTCEDGTPAQSGTVGMGELLFTPPSELTGYNAQFAQLSAGGGGAFSFGVAPGVTRRLYFVYAPPNGSYLTVGPGFLTFIQRVRPRLHVRPKRVRVGKATRFRGSIPGPFYSGRPVIALQARSGRRWRTFKVLPLSPAGKFSGKYRFSGTSQPSLYRFRAKPVIGGAVYRYAVRPSKQKRVAVRP